MKDYPYFKAYVAEILMDTMRMSQSEKGDYLDGLMISWKTMNPEKMPDWMREYADDTISKSRKLSENSKVRWVKAMQLHSNCIPNAMQNTYIEDRIGEDRIGEEKRKENKKKSTTSKKELFDSIVIPENLLLVVGFSEAWESWLQHKREIKQKMPETTINAQLKQLSKMCDPIGSIQQSIQQPWRGLFEPKGTQVSTNANNGYNAPYKAKTTLVQEHNIRVCKELDEMMEKTYGVKPKNEAQQLA